ncbi:MAG: hypothetical protein WA001_03815 [Patescibacteria group bacterium]
MILFLRILPVLVGLLEAFVFWSQRTQPGLYPWIAIVGVVAVPCASLLIGWGRVPFADLLEKMAPTFLLMAALAFGLLLVEGSAAFWIIVTLAAVSSFVSLELLFLLAFHPSAYPVNALSRVNIAYVPLIIWYAVSTSSGLMVFLHIDRTLPVLMCGVLGALLFRTTGHPGATRRQNATWTVLGGLIGLEIGMLGLLLPLSIEMQGLVATILFCAALRVRRYLYEPKPSRRVAWIEASAALVLFIGSLISAKWL